jgi:L-aspartate oxidase
METLTTDYLVIGSGLAGLWFTYKVKDTGKVILVTKKESAESNTNYAQGGIAVALGEDDTPELHLKDTLKAGEGLAKEEIVRMVVESGPELVKELFSLGVDFSIYYNSTGKLRFDLGREGGHSRRRIVHARDYTGMAIEETLLSLLKGKKGVEIRPNHFLLDLIVEEKRCFGAFVYDLEKKKVLKIIARITLLATGGIGQLYLHTTNPPIATGDGIAIAFLKGVPVCNMEFIQFHPTSLYGHKVNGRAFLISEAVRGEGGVLRNWRGEAFMKRYSEAGDLAPRDVVARACYNEMKMENKEYLFLDLTHLNPFRIKERFPNIYNTCRQLGIDITKEMIPVVPACHYLCGGLLINQDGETEIKGLFAAGECSYSGMHGANRLASNSLLSTLVFADRAGKTARTKSEDIKIDPDKIREGPFSSDLPLGRERVKKITGEIKRTMWDNVGIVRTDAGLTHNRDFLRRLWKEISEIERKKGIVLDPEFLEMRNMALVGLLITESAIWRKESRGLHYNLDHPERDDRNYLKDTILNQQILE